MTSIARKVSQVDLLGQTDLSSENFKPAVMGRRTTMERRPRFSQDLGDAKLFRMKMEPTRRDLTFPYHELRKYGRRIENNHMESTFHPCLYIPSDPIEFRPYLVNLVRGTLVQERERRLRAAQRTETWQDAKACTL